MSTGRYQSRVFNFLSQQSLRLRDRSAQTWRQVKVAAVWGVQILLYPVYVGFQSTRLVEKQLQQTARQTVPRLRSAGRALQVRKPQLGSMMPPVDAPLQTVLQTAKQTALTDAALQIQGIASRLDTGSLVLVTSQNQTLDLSFEQQTELTRRIAWETANYWRQRRLFNPPPPAPISTFLPPVKPHRNALLPIRVLQTVMAWMQRGSVAVSADLFQESRLVVYLPSQPALMESEEPVLRSAQPSWVIMEAQFYDWLEQAGQATTDLLLAGLKSGQVTFSDIVSRFVAGRAESQFPSIPNPLQQAKLPAAGDWLPLLDRWLSKVPGLDQPQLPTSSHSQPWLTMEDLFDQPDRRLSSNLKVAQNPEPLLPPPSQISLKTWLKRSLRSVLPEQQTTPIESPAVWETTDTAALETAIKTSRIKWTQVKWSSSKLSRKANPAPPQQSAAVIQSYPSAMVEFHADQRLTTPRPINPLDQVAPLSSLDTANQEEAAMLPQSWIETEAKLVEYVKHPLEQLLEWLDQSMLWLETRLAKVWRWLTRPIE